MTFWMSFFDESEQCVLPKAPAPAAAPGKKRAPYKRREVGLCVAPKISWKVSSRVYDHISDEEDDEYVPSGDEGEWEDEEDDMDAEEWEKERLLVQRVLDFQEREDGTEYLVEYVEPMEGELPSWVNESLLTSPSAKKAIKEFKDERDAKRRQRNRYTGEVFEERTRGQRRRT